MFTHFARDVGDNHMPIFELDAELGIRQVLQNRAFHFNMFFFCHAIKWASARIFLKSAEYTQVPDLPTDCQDLVICA